MLWFQKHVILLATTPHVKRESHSGLLFSFKRARSAPLEGMVKDRRETR